MLPLLTTALAADLSDSHLMLGVGIEAVTNDPFVLRRGIRHSVGWSPNAWAEVGVSATWYPNLGEEDWTPLSKELLLRNSVGQGLSRILAQGQLTLRIHALRAPLGEGWTGSFGALAGVAVFATHDDDEYPREGADSSQDQLHGGSAVGGFVQARTRWMGVRVRYESDVYIETLYFTTLEFKDNAMFGVELLCWL